MGDINSIPFHSCLSCFYSHVAPLLFSWKPHTTRGLLPSYIATYTTTSSVQSPYFAPSPLFSQPKLHSILIPRWNEEFLRYPFNHPCIHARCSCPSMPNPYQNVIPNQIPKVPFQDIANYQTSHCTIPGELSFERNPAACPPSSTRTSIQPKNDVKSNHPKSLPVQPTNTTAQSRGYIFPRSTTCP